MHAIEGGVTAAKGFSAAGIYCGIRKNRSKSDLALLVSEVPCTAAAVYTQNLVKGAPVLVTQKNLENGKAQAVICNSGNANTCNADGIEIAEKMCAAAGEALKISAQDIIVASTGVIGQPLPLKPILEGIPKLAQALSPSGSQQAAKAIMTTDTVLKEVAAEEEINGKLVRLGGIAKGSGMIHPNMATMLCFLTTDAAISASALACAMQEAVGESFNMVSVDGDTSTNDMTSILANGLAQNEEITEGTPAFAVFVRMLKNVCVQLARSIAKDGEGATKLLVCKVSGAECTESARTVAKSVICSSLVKAAMFGSDANWGRVLCAIGYAGVPVRIQAVDVAFASKAGKIDVCKDGAGIAFSEEDAKTILSEDEIEILVSLKDGAAQASAYGCDLTYDYVKINGDYRT